MDWEVSSPPVDEDEGSLPQGRVNRPGARHEHSAAPQDASLEAGKIERSAEAFQVRRHLISFPPTDNPTKPEAWIGDPGRVTIPNAAR
jgi:hypothetical protein